MNVKGIVVGIAFMLLFAFPVNTFFYEKVKENNFVEIINNGKTLYVGSSGPGNYTRIQDAINDSSSYYENLFKFIRDLENISSDLKKALLQIINTVINTSKICNEVCSGIDKEKYLANREMYSSHRNRNKEIIKKMDIQKIRKACAMILYTLKKEIPILEKNSIHYKFPTFKYPPFIAIGGRGNDSYYYDYYIIIDFGGDDKYYNNAGSTVIYYNGEIIGGVSICIDLEGNDFYESGWFNSQGSGVFGIGILYDVKGNDTYISEDCSQGEGEAGIGILIDKEGNDVYQTTPLGFSQGSSMEWGTGILLDMKGNDSYISYSLSQAAADYFSFSTLIDFSGNDLYKSKSFSQSYAGFMSTSLLLDFHGNDVFIGEEQGNAILGFALFINLLGYDEYSGKGKNNAIWLNGFIAIGIDVGK